MNDLTLIAKEAELPPHLIKTVNELLEIDKNTKHLLNIQALLSWDQEVKMPSQGIECRMEQMSLLEKMIHDHITHERIPEILHVLGVTEENQKGDETLPEHIRLWLRCKYYQWRRSSSLPPALLQEIVKLRVRSHHVWIHAKKTNNFEMFAPLLKKTIDLQREKASCIGFQESMYDALLGEFEFETTSAEITTLFHELKTKLQPLYDRVIEKHQSLSFKDVVMSEKEQQNFCRYLANNISYTDDVGRIDDSAHPCCTHIGMGDTRITTRYIPENPLSSIFSVLHEIGHAFYSLGISDIYQNTVCDEGSSYGIHESQSRFIENVVGRSRSFWSYYHPQLQKYSDAYQGDSLDTFMNRINHIAPSPIRVESNELAYNFHIILRFELEKDLIEGSLDVNDLPSAWNEKTKQFFGTPPINDTEGVLQDVHWSEGFFGYFPSYALGNIYAAKIYEDIQTGLPDFEKYLQRGSLSEIKEWLGTHIHMHGASKTPSELLPLSVDSIMKYLSERYDN